MFSASLFPIWVLDALIFYFENQNEKEQWDARKKGKHL
jgi:hypothetical protein